MRVANRFQARPEPADRHWLDGRKVDQAPDPAAKVIHFKTYPQPLHGFLRRRGYLR
jgi:hypothetical protein